MKIAMKYANVKDTDCKDIRIALIENNSCVRSKLVFDELPLKMFEGDSQHSYHTGWIVRQICPKAKIFLLPRGNESLKWCMDNDIDILSVSLTGAGTTDNVEIELSKSIFNLISAGNSGKLGDNTLSLEAKEKHWISIGAIHLVDYVKEIRIDYPTYSSKGEELDFVCLSGMKDNLGYRMNGTSFSSPFAVSLLAQYKQLHKDFFGYKPSIEKMYKFMLDNAIDLKTDGHDIYTGNGVFILPKVLKFKVDPKNKKRAIFEKFVLMFWKNGLTEKRKKSLLKKWGVYLGV